MKNIFAKTLSIVLLTILAAGFTYQQAEAQFSIGASYEIRSNNPTNGFGIRIENDLPLKLPLVAIGVRAQFSNFSEKNSLTTNSVTYDQKLDHYNIGLLALAKVKLGLLSPYAGLGIGTNHLNVKNTGPISFGGPKNKTKIYYEGVLGASATLLPLIHPFIEYRLQKNNISGVINGYRAKDSNGIWAFGVSLQF
ncbi:MAG TPA: outer membrane beta-barrel protein [Balneolales bacterium]|jgi:opacity protein-like surface antigen|nr:outer membrane beta-barrel protein [Balneolales bacterium]